MNQAILIHSSRFRNKLCQKITEFQTYIDQSRITRRWRRTRIIDFHKKYDRIQLIVNRIREVLQSIRRDPLYIE